MLPDTLIPYLNPHMILSKKEKENQWSAAPQIRIYAVYDFGKQYLINCVIIRLLMRRQNSTWTSGQPAGYITINLWWHQTSVQALMQSFLIINVVFFINEKYKQLFDCYWTPTGCTCCASYNGWNTKTHRTLLILNKKFSLGPLIVLLNKIW